MGCDVPKAQTGSRREGELRGEICCATGPENFSPKELRACFRKKLSLVISLDFLSLLRYKIKSLPLVSTEHMKLWFPLSLQVGVYKVSLQPGG